MSEADKKEVREEALLQWLLFFGCLTWTHWTLRQAEFYKKPRERDIPQWSECFRKDLEFSGCFSVELKGFWPGEQQAWAFLEKQGRCHDTIITSRKPLSSSWNGFAKPLLCFSQDPHGHLHMGSAMLMFIVALLLQWSTTSKNRKAPFSRKNCVGHDTMVVKVEKSCEASKSCYLRQALIEGTLKVPYDSQKRCAVDLCMPICVF